MARGGDPSRAMLLPAATAAPTGGGDMTEGQTERERFDAAVMAYQLADYESAITEFGQLYQEFQRQAYLFNQASACLRAGRFEEAKQGFASCVGAVGQSRDPHVTALEGYYLAAMGWADYDLFGNVE